MIFSMVFWTMFYLAFFLLLPRSLYLFWKKRRIAGLIAMAIFLAPIIYVMEQDWSDYKTSLQASENHLIQLVSNKKK